MAVISNLRFSNPLDTYIARRKKMKKTLFLLKLMLFFDSVASMYCNGGRCEVFSTVPA
jgi:hypothetical protein